MDLNTLVWNNFIGMIRRGEVSSLMQIKSNPRKLLDLLKSVGADEKLLSKPAHREELENYFKDLLDYITAGIREEEGLELERTYNGIRFHYENLHFQKDSSLTFDILEDNKSVESYKISIKQNTGIKSRVISGKPDVINEQIETESMSFPIVTTRQSIKRKLDNMGFVSSKIIKTGTKSNNSFSFKTERYERNGLNILLRKDDDQIQKQVTKEGNDSSKIRNIRKISWNGRPEDINIKSSEYKEFMANMLEIIEKYPETKSYYEKLVGKDIMDIALKIKKQPRR